MNLKLNDSRPFWMVWNQDGCGAPRVRHYDETTALQEAERLARKCPRQTFIVLRAVAARWVDDMNRVAFDGPAEDLPFGA